MTTSSSQSRDWAHGPARDLACDPALDETGDKTRELTRLRIDLAYDGTDFHGWARQKPQDGEELRTVQGVIEDALSLVLRAPLQLTVAGRTDAGVHSAGQVCHVDVPANSL